MSGPTDPAEVYFDKGSWGWDGTAWRKLPLLLGYTDRWVEQQSDLSADVGTNTLATVVVPAGSIYRVDMVSAFNQTSACSIMLLAVGDGIDVTFGPYTAFAATMQHNVFPVGIYLKAGDYLIAYYFDCTAGDDLFLRVWGLKMGVG